MKKAFYRRGTWTRLPSNFGRVSLSTQHRILVSCRRHRGAGRISRCQPRTCCSRPGGLRFGAQTVTDSMKPFCKLFAAHRSWLSRPCLVSRPALNCVYPIKQLRYNSALPARMADLGVVKSPRVWWKEVVVYQVYLAYQLSSANTEESLDLSGLFS